MKNNKQVLNEAFFNQDSYSDKIEKRMPAYQPVSVSNSGKDQTAAAFAVTDAGEMKQRLAKSFGAAFGNNNIKSMANKALKTFPIIVSDNVEPETVIAMKKLMEEQYADYISLLISNQVIDLSAYEAAGSEDGSTIAIQALDKISGTDFSSTRIANKATNTGNITPDDIFANIPLYNLLREHNQTIKTGDSLTDAILENCLVVPSDHVKDIQKFFNENTDVADFGEMLDERLIMNTYQEYPPEYALKNQRAEDLLKSMAQENGYNDKVNNIKAKDKAMDALLGYDDGKISKLTNTDIILDKDKFNDAVNKTIGEFLLDPKNGAIRDKFEKASFLLQSGMIAGTEYIDYCTLRLGIPMSSKVRAELSTKFKVEKVKTGNRKGDYRDSIFVTEAEAKSILRNEKTFGKIIPQVLKNKVSKAVLAASAVGMGVGAGLMTAGALMNPIGIAVLATSAVGTGAYLIYKLIRARKEGAVSLDKMNKIEGWERVEALIEALDKQRSTVISSSVNNIQLGKGYSQDEADAIKALYKGEADLDKDSYESSMKDYSKTINAVNNPGGSNVGDNRPLSGKEIDDLIDNKVSKYFKSIALRESVDDPDITCTINYPKAYIENFLEDFSQVYDECMSEEFFRNSVLSESLLSSIRARALEKQLAKGTSTKMKTKYITKNPEKDLLITPEFSARSAYAYGTTEIDPKLVKDRKYNQPLLMTIKFRERMDDGRFSDNELTAVIGILGRVIRVPSEEMKYILVANSEGETIKGAFKSGEFKNLVADLFSTSKIAKDVKALPQSADVWRNLEKVAQLAVANKMAGKKTNNVANAHIIFSEKEIDEARLECGVDYKRDMKSTAQLMKRYSAFTLMIADDVAQRMYIYNDVDDIAWNVVPYNALIGKDTGDQLTSALARLGRM